jgi:diguanylate cyclase (GGDEF)-like protein
MNKPVREIDDLVKLAFFTDLATSITGARTIKATLQEVMSAIGTIFAPRNWSLFLRDPATGELTFTVVVGSAVEHLLGRRLPPGGGIVGWIADNALPLIIEDVSKDPRFDAASDLSSGFKTRSIIGVPLVSRSKVIGVLELINELEDREFTPLDLKILQTIADFAAIAIERNYYLQALRRLSTIDPLTGLANRRSFERLLLREKERTLRSGTGFALLVIDVDDFKSINDSRGHETGDELLRDLAGILTASCRKMDSVARIGGDEFVVLLPNTDHARAEEVRERIMAAVAAHRVAGDLPFSVSIGLETADKDGVDTAFAAADRDMYAKKQLRQEREIEHVEMNLGNFLAEEE